MDPEASLGVEDVFHFADVTTEEGGWLVVNTMEPPPAALTDAVSYLPSPGELLERAIDREDLPEIERDLFPEEAVRLLFLAMDDVPGLVLQKCVVRLNHDPSGKKVVDSFTEWACKMAADGNWKSRFLEGLALIGRLDILDMLGLDRQQIQSLQRPVHLSSLKVSVNEVCCSLRHDESMQLVRFVKQRYLPNRPIPIFPDGCILKQLLELHVLYWMQEGVMDWANLTVLAEGLEQIGRHDLRKVLVGRPVAAPAVAAAAAGLETLDISEAERGQHSKVVTLPAIGTLPPSVMYPNSSGICVVFNQEQFRCTTPETCQLNDLDHHGLRMGSSRDAENLEALFRDFRCRTKVFNDLKSSQIMQCLKHLATAHDLNRYDFVVLCFLSHGGISSDGRQYIFSSDCRMLWMDDLVEPFEGHSCRALSGRLKMVITQACQGLRMLHPVTADGPESDVSSQGSDAPLPRRATSQSDFLFCQATTPGFKAYRDPRNGSFYVQRLCEVLRNRGHLEEVTLCIKDVHNLLISNPIEVGKERRVADIQPQMIDRTQGRFRFRRLDEQQSV